jgi:hypothetical protein
MTAKSKTVGVESVWLRKIDGGTGNEAWFVCNLIDPGGVEFVPASALAELREQCVNWQGSAGQYKVELLEAELRMQSLISGLEALAGEIERVGPLCSFELVSKKLRALIPAAAKE